MSIKENDKDIDILIAGPSITRLEFLQINHHINKYNYFKNNHGKLKMFTRTLLKHKSKHKS